MTTELIFEGWSGDAVSVEVATGRLRGDWRAVTPAARDWETGLDFRPPVELCYCCGQELLLSGSRWSVWFCGECKGRVIALNARVGKCVVPIGRHSLMNGVTIETADIERDPEIERFVGRFHEMARGIDRLSEWSREIVRLNCARAGIPAVAAVALADYVGRVRDAGLSRRLAFLAMLETSDQGSR